MPFLRELNRAILDVPGIDHIYPQEVIASGWLGHPGATEDDLIILERRLGISLPPSYRSFLAVSNGWPGGPYVVPRALWPSSRVEWFRVEHRDWIDVYLKPQWGDPLPPVSDLDYFVYDSTQEAGLFRPEYLETALQLGEPSTSGDGVYLLNPQVIAADGEWEAMHFAGYLNGASRYRSFRELMQYAYDTTVLIRRNHLEEGRG